MQEKIKQYELDLSDALKIDDFKEKSSRIREIHKSFNSSLSDAELAEYRLIREKELLLEGITRKSRYSEYLQSKEWNKLKAKVINRANGTCEGCDTKSILEVHHLTYDRVGMELMTDLVAFCPNCHRKAHGITVKSDWNMYICGDGVMPKGYDDMTDNEKEEYFNKLTEGII